MICARRRSDCAGSDQELTAAGEFVRKWGSQGTGNGQFSTLQDLAIDAAGHLWAIDSGLAGGGVRVQQFSSEGAYLSQFGSKGTEPGQFSSPEAIAIDSAGNVWVADTANNRVQEFKPSGEFIRKWGTAGTAAGQLSSPRGLAVDSGDDVWVSDSGNNRIQAFSPSGEYLSQLASGGNNDVQLAEPRGLALDAGGNIWVADTANNRVAEWSYVGEPSSTTNTATQLTAAGATLNGFVNPGGRATTYRFEYGASTSYGNSVPVPAGQMGATIADQSVSEKVEGLSEGTTYHFRLVAESSRGTATGEDMTFTTPELPEAATGPATNVKAASATLAGSVNAKGLSTTVKFEYGTSTQYGSSAFAFLPVTGVSSVAVARTISGLQESTTYHYRVVATSSAGTVTGEDETFTTEAFPETTFTSSHPSYTSHEINTVAFDSSKPGSTFKCSLDRTDGKAITPCSSPYELPSGLSAGTHTFVVAAVDPAGNVDPTPAKWTFNTAIWPPAPSSSKITSPEAGKKTGSYYTLQAGWAVDSSQGLTGLGFQMKLPAWDAFKEVPVECVLDGEGKQVTWPLSIDASAGHSAPIFLGVRDCPLFAGAGFPERTSSSGPSSTGATAQPGPASRCRPNSSACATRAACRRMPWKRSGRPPSTSSPAPSPLAAPMSQSRCRAPKRSSNSPAPMTRPSATTSPTTPSSWVAPGSPRTRWNPNTKAKPGPS